MDSLIDFLASSACDLKKNKKISNAALSDLMHHYFGVSVSTRRIDEKIKWFQRRSKNSLSTNLPPDISSSPLKRSLIGAYSYLHNNQCTDILQPAIDITLLKKATNQFIARFTNIIDLLTILIENEAIDWFWLFNVFSHLFNLYSNIYSFNICIQG